MRRGLSWVALVLGGCASFEGKPIDPAKTEAAFRSRSLSDPGLGAYLLASLPGRFPAFPPESWDLDALTMVAWYFHPDLDEARSRVRLAEAAVTTAGGRPNPVIGVAPGYTDSPESPLLLKLDFDLPIETAGKRGHRIAQANALTDAARLGLAEAAWRVRSRLRTALLDHLLTLRRVEALRTEEAARSEAVAVLESRFAVGEVSRPEVDTVRISLDTARLLLRAAEGRLTETLVTLADSVGLPPSALDEARFEWPEWDQPPPEEALSPSTLQGAGLLNRLDVRRVLSEYTAAEAALQLEVAKQYPDVHLSPGYEFDDGANKYTLGLSVTLPVLNQNQGPIAEAEARRKGVAARFLSLQAQVIGETARALVRYRAALAESAEVDSLLATLRGRGEAMAQAVEIGEEDRLTLTGVRVEQANAGRARLEALAKVQAALGALEDAVQRPVGPEGPLPGFTRTGPEVETAEEDRR